MTNENIRVFLTLCKTGNISNAAEQLFISQSAVTRIIQSMEQELGYSLLVRRKGIRHTELTLEGQRFYRIAREMNTLYEQALQRDQEDMVCTFRLLTASNFVPSFVPQACRRFLEAHPNVNLMTDVAHSEYSMRQVQEGYADAAITTLHSFSPQLMCVPLFKEKMVLLTSKGKFSPGPVNPALLNLNEAMLTDYGPEYQAWFEKYFGHDWQTTVRHTVMTGSHMKYYGKNRNFWSLLSILSARSNLEEDTEIHDLLYPPPPRTCYYVYSAMGNKSLQLDYLETLREALTDIPNIQLF